MARLLHRIYLLQLQLLFSVSRRNSIENLSQKIPFTTTKTKTFHWIHFFCVQSMPAFTLKVTSFNVSLLSNIYAETMDD